MLSMWNRGERNEEPGIIPQGEESQRESSPPNFLDIIPIPLMDHVQKDWQVGFDLPRFKSRFWSWFFTNLGASETYLVRLDRMGSEIWGYINGERTVREILVRLELKHRDEPDLRDRFISYLKRLKFHGFIDLVIPEDEEQEEPEEGTGKETTGGRGVEQQEQA